MRQPPTSMRSRILSARTDVGNMRPGIECWPPQARDARHLPAAATATATTGTARPGGWLRRYRFEAHATTRDPAPASAISCRDGAGRASRLLVVRLSSERVRQAVRQDCSFAKKQASPPALLGVVRLDSAAAVC